MVKKKTRFSIRLGELNIQGQVEDSDITKETKKTLDDNNGYECSKNILLS